MPVPNFVPSLSEDGWVDSPELMGDYVLSHFFVSDYSQTHLYKNSVSSLPYLVQKYQGDINGLLSSVQSTLQIYLSRYFTGVIVEANPVPNPTNSNKIGFSIYVSYVGNDGNTYTLERLIHTNNSKILEIINTNNG